MKGIIMDLNDISDSRELMETREAPGIRWFIMIVLLIFLSGIGFACFSDMDEYVRVRGEVKTANAQGDVTSASSCRINSVNVSEGQKVSAGETLFVLDSDYARKQKKIIEDQLLSYESDLENTKLLKKSVEENKNLFTNKGEESKFYYRYEQYNNGILLSSNELENKKNDKNQSMEEKKNRQKTNKDNILKKNELLLAYKDLLNAVQNDYTYNGSNAEALATYNEYATSCEKAAVTAEQCRIAYEDKLARLGSGGEISEIQVDEAKREADKAQSRMESCRNSYLDDIRTQILLLSASSDDDDKAKLEAYQELRSAIEQNSEPDTDVTETTDIYRKYSDEINELNSQYEKKQQEYDSILSSYTSQRSRVSQSEVDSAELAWKNAELDAENIKNSFVSKIQSRISSLEEEISSLKNTEKDLEMSLQSNEDIKEYERISGEQLKTEAIISLDSEIDALKKNIASAETQLTELDDTIGNSEIKANVSGTVTLVNELNEGDIVQAGENLCTIVPDSDGLKVMLYIPESEVTKLEVGQSAEYTFDALSYSEKGKVTGTIQSISADSVTDSTTGAKYYIAQADITETDQNGEQKNTAIVKNGMQLNGKVVNGSKKTIVWFLEKIHLKEK